MKESGKQAPAATELRPARKYPNNGLKEPVRPFDSTFSGADLMLELVKENAPQRHSR